MAEKTTEVVCANLIRDSDGRICLVRETKPEALGRWSMPAGRAETGESLAEAAEREALEETGLIVETGPLVGIYHAPQTLEGGSAVHFVFESHVIGGAQTTSSHHPEVEFFDAEAIASLVETKMIRGQHTARAIEALLAGQRLDDEIIVTVAASPPPLAGDPATSQS